MSDLAVSGSGEQKTASEFHDDYILHEIEHESFSCPFCLIGLMAKATYIKGPQARSPHFSHFRYKPHINDCDGYPLIDGKSVKGAKKENTIKIGKEVFSFPEKLISRIKLPQNKSIDDLDDMIRNDTPEKVKLRRKNAGKKTGKAKYTSAIIRTFASSKKEIISLVYKHAKKEGMSNGNRKALLKEVLTQAPIELDGYKTNYQVAFQWTKYFSKYNKIWNGIGTVKINGDLIYIQSDQSTEYNEDGEIHELDFIAILKISNAARAYHRTIVDSLIEVRKRKLIIKWFAYGTAKIDLEKNVVLLEIDNLDHVFIEEF